MANNCEQWIKFSSPWYACLKGCIELLEKLELQTRKLKIIYRKIEIEEKKSKNNVLVNLDTSKAGQKLQCGWSSEEKQVYEVLLRTRVED